MAIEMTRTVAIRRYFAGIGRTVTIAELKELSLEDRKWYGDECLRALGAVLAPPTTSEM